jgi:hypothetical protein
MAQAVSYRSLTAEARVYARDSPGQWQIKWQWDSFFFQILLFSPILFHRDSPHSYTVWGMSTRIVGGRSSETVSRHLRRKKTCPIIMCHTRIRLEIEDRYKCLCQDNRQWLRLSTPENVQRPCYSDLPSIINTNLVSTD